jgi:predicted DNA-binding transcriptional regulator AlpA
MKELTISGNIAAPPVSEQSIPSSHSFHEPWVTLRDVTRHFGMSRTTIWRNINDHQMPFHPLGTHRLRFVISEIQQWLERTGRRRFASIGRTSTLAALKQTISANPRLARLRIQISVPESAPTGGRRKLSKKIMKQSLRSPTCRIVSKTLRHDH